MRRVIVAKARSTRHDEPIEDVEIVVGGDGREFPDGGSLQELCARFEQEADLLAGALRASLPGGTLDRLLAALLTDRARSLRVRVGDLPDPPDLQLAADLGRALRQRDAEHEVAASLRARLSQAIALCKELVGMDDEEGRGEWDLSYVTQTLRRVAALEGP